MVNFDISVQRFNEFAAEYAERFMNILIITADPIWRIRLLKVGLRSVILNFRITPKPMGEYLQT